MDGMVSSGRLRQPDSRPVILNSLGALPGSAASSSAGGNAARGVECSFRRPHRSVGEALCALAPPLPPTSPAAPDRDSITPDRHTLSRGTGDSLAFVHSVIDKRRPM